MKIGFRKTEGSVTTAAVVNLSPREQVAIAKEVLYALLDVPEEGYFIRDGKVWNDWEGKPVREVRPLDVEIFAVLDRLQRGDF